MSGVDAADPNGSRPARRLHRRTVCVSCPPTAALGAGEERRLTLGRSIRNHRLLPTTSDQSRRVENLALCDAHASLLWQRLRSILTVGAHHATGLGPRGIGSVRPLCTRVVLDANCVRGSPVAELEAIRARGFRISISIEGLREVWARSIRENNYRLLAGRVRKLAPFVDQEHPIAFIGNALIAQIARKDSAFVVEQAAWRAPIEQRWKDITRGGLSETVWRQVGTDLDEELAGEEAQWLHYVQQYVELGRRLRDFRKAGADYPRQRAISILLRVLGEASARSVPHPSFGGRGHAFLRVMASKLVDALGKPPAVNDWIDTRHLFHLAWPTFVMTADRKSIAAVDAADTYQRAWVRMPVELAQDSVSRCFPWGASARRADARFTHAVA
jgi:hypothetical protein